MNRVEDRKSVHVKGRDLLGLIVYIEGGVGYFSTPHGSIFRSGLVWLRTDIEPLTKEDRKTLVSYLLDARRSGIRYKQLHERAKELHLYWKEHGVDRND